MHKITMELVKVGSNMVSYKQVTDEAPIVTSIYVHRWALKDCTGEFPKLIQVTIDPLVEI